MSLGLGLWWAKPDTFDDGHTSIFPKVGGSDVDELTEPAAATLGDLGLDFLGALPGH